MFNISKQQCVLAVAILVASTSAMSKEISYDYVQGTYISSTDSSIPGFDINADGFGFSGSFSVSPNVALTAGFGATSFDRIQGIDIDATSIDFGITAHTSVGPKTDILGNFSILLVDVEASDGFITISDDDTGNVISVGLRHMASDAVELEVGFSRADIFDDTSNTIGFGARFYANDKVSLGAGYSTGDDVDSLILNVRIDI